MLSLYLDGFYRDKSVHFDIICKNYLVLNISRKDVLVVFASVFFKKYKICLQKNNLLIICGLNLIKEQNENSED